MVIFLSLIFNKFVDCISFIKQAITFFLNSYIAHLSTFQAAILLSPSKKSKTKNQHTYKNKSGT